MDDMGDKLKTGTIATLVIGFLVLVAYAAIKRQEWLTAHCTVISRVAGTNSTITTFGTDGEMHTGSVFTPGKTEYKCDDGVTYLE